MEKEPTKAEVMKVEISRRQRNNIFHHLQLPYYIGKTVRRFTIHLGKATVEKGFDAGRGTVTIGELVGHKIGKGIKVLEVFVVKKDKDSE